MKRISLAVAAALLTAALHPGGASAESRVIVKYRKAASTGKRRASVRALGDARVLEVAGGAWEAAQRLARSPAVAWAEPDYELRALGAPDDPLLAQLGGLGLMHAQAAWDALGLSTDWPRDGGAPVAVVDTGIDDGHEDLVGQVEACASSVGGSVEEGGCADDDGHGTHTAGTVAAIAGNSLGIAGVAFDAPLMVCKALGADGSGDTSDVANCIEWAHSRGAKVISLSLGGPASTTLRAAVKAAWAGGGRDGSVVVAAAGNDGDAGTEYPAGYPEVVSVGAVDDSGSHAWFSNANEDVEVAAPGVDVLSLKAGGGYIRMSGTSMATPNAAGAAALEWEAHPRSSARTIRRRLDDLAADAGPAGRDPEYGFGVLDLARMADE